MLPPYVSELICFLPISIVAAHRLWAPADILIKLTTAYYLINVVHKQ